MIESHVTFVIIEIKQMSAPDNAPKTAAKNADKTIQPSIVIMEEKAENPIIEHIGELIFGRG